MSKYLFTIATRHFCPVDQIDRDELALINGAIGNLLPRDSGKRVYQTGDVVQVENDDQVKARMQTYKAACAVGVGGLLTDAYGAIWKVSDWAARPSPQAYGRRVIGSAVMPYKALPGGLGRL